MSLLEDVFLQDEAHEAQELERIIDGDEFDERPRSVAENSDENSEKEDEAEEDKRRVDPNTTKTKRLVKNPRVTLNPARLTGPRGIHIIAEHFKDFKFKGKGHEKEDLDLVLKKLEHWAYRLYPKFGFEDCLKKIETLGKKRPVMVHLHKIRSDQFMAEDTVVQKDSSDDEATSVPQQEDEFDKLLQQQIAIARASPAPGSVKKLGFDTPKPDNRSPIIMPKATSSPSISDDQKERMMRNRRLAEERRLSKLKQNMDTSNVNNTSVFSEITGVVSIKNTDKSEDNINDPINVMTKKNYGSNVIDSSDEESELINHSVTVDINTNDEHTRNEESINRNKIVKENNRSRTIESADESDSESHLVIDLEKHNNKGIIRNKNKMDTNKGKDLFDTNQTDSSDDECDLQSLNYSVTIDVHNDSNIKRVQNIVESMDTTNIVTDLEKSDNNAIFDTVRNDDAHIQENIQSLSKKLNLENIVNVSDLKYQGCVKNKEENIDEQNNGKPTTFTDESKDVKVDNIEKSNEIIDVVLRENDKKSAIIPDKDNISKEKENKTAINKTMEDKQSNFKDKENVDNNVTNKDFGDDLMDIDFNDEF